jgi:hypothetical protein
MKTYSIVGMNWLKSEEVVGGLKPGAVVTLAREPTNPVDSNAVAVYADGIKVGYIPKKQNVALANYIDQLGTDWTPPAPAGMAADQAPNAARSIPAKFTRSPKSGYPMVDVSE